MGRGLRIAHNAKVFGWLLPSGKFVECDKYEHISIAFEHKKIYRVLPPKFQAEVDRLRSLQNDCEIAAALGDHPEWHCYEMAADRTDKAAVWASLLDAGCLRVAALDDRMYFEGRGEHLARLKQRAQDLAESYGLTAELERQAR